MPAYADFHKEVQERRRKRVGTPGDPTASAAAVLKIVDADEPPLRCFFGSAPLDIAKVDYEQRLAAWEAWQPVAELAQGSLRHPVRIRQDGDPLAAERIERR